jgi:hypothetical protein
MADEIAKFVKATINGRPARKTQSLMRGLFEEAQWILNADGFLTLEIEGDGDPLTITGTWEYDEENE